MQALPGSQHYCAGALIISYLSDIKTWKSLTQIKDHQVSDCTQYCPGLLPLPFGCLLSMNHLKVRDRGAQQAQ